MCVKFLLEILNKFLLEILNSSLYLLHLTSTYTYGVTNAPRVCGGTFFLKTMSILINVAKIKSWKSSIISIYNKYIN